MNVQAEQLYSQDGAYGEKKLAASIDAEDIIQIFH